MHWEEFKWNCKKHQLDLMTKEKVRGFRIYFVWNSSLKRFESQPQLGRPTDLAGNGLNWLSHIADAFYALQFRISCKIYSKTSEAHSFALWRSCWCFLLYYSNFSLYIVICKFFCCLIISRMIQLVRISVWIVDKISNFFSWFKDF